MSGILRCIRRAAHRRLGRRLACCRRSFTCTAVVLIVVAHRRAAAAAARRDIRQRRDRHRARATTMPTKRRLAGTTASPSRGRDALRRPDPPPRHCPDVAADRCRRRPRPHSRELARRAVAQAPACRRKRAADTAAGRRPGERPRVRRRGRGHAISSTCSIARAAWRARRWRPPSSSCIESLDSLYERPPVPRHLLQSADAALRPERRRTASRRSPRTATRSWPRGSSAGSRPTAAPIDCRRCARLCKCNPDVIFFLTDADDPMPRERARRRSPSSIARAGVVISTIEFGRGPAKQAKNFLTELARTTGGQYGYVDTTKLRGSQT